MKTLGGTKKICIFTQKFKKKKKFVIQGWQIDNVGFGNASSNDSLGTQKSVIPTKNVQKQNVLH